MRDDMTRRQNATALRQDQRMDLRRLAKLSANKIADLVPGVEDAAAVHVILRLAEAYTYLAAEPPRAGRQVSQSVWETQCAWSRKRG